MLDMGANHLIKYRNNVTPFGQKTRNNVINKAIYLLDMYPKLHADYIV